MESMGAHAKQFENSYGKILVLLPKISDYHGCLQGTLTPFFLMMKSMEDQ